MMYVHATVAQVYYIKGLIALKDRLSLILGWEKMVPNGDFHLALKFL